MCVCVCIKNIYGLYEIPRRHIVVVYVYKFIRVRDIFIYSREYMVRAYVAHLCMCVCMCVCVCIIIYEMRKNISYVYIKYIVYMCVYSSDTSSYDKTGFYLKRGSDILASRNYYT